MQLKVPYSFLICFKCHSIIHTFGVVFNNLIELGCISIYNLLELKTFAYGVNRSLVYFRQL